MLIEFLGHSCFHLLLDSGLSLLIDPYEPNGLGGRLRYRPVSIEPRWVLITHEHPDHSDLSWVGSQATVVRETMSDGVLSVTARTAVHDEHGGKLRAGDTRLFVIEIDGVRLLHCGDLGERLLPDQIEAFGPIDVAMIPVGGYYTLGSSAAAELVGRLKPTYVLPCHYRTAVTDMLELAGVDAFTRRFGEVREAPNLDPRVAPRVTPTVVVLDALGL